MPGVSRRTTVALGGSALQGYGHVSCCSSGAYNLRHCDPFSSHYKSGSRGTTGSNLIFTGYFRNPFGRVASRRCSNSISCKDDLALHLRNPLLLHCDRTVTTASGIANQKQLDPKALRCPIRIHAAVSTPELCWRLCDEGRGEELAANLVSSILDALRGPQGSSLPRQGPFSGEWPPDPAPHQKGWEELRAELHEALRLLFDDQTPMPRSLSDIRIDLSLKPADKDPQGFLEERSVSAVERRKCRTPELVFGVLNSGLAPSAAPRQRSLAQDAFQSVVKEHFALMPRSAEAVNLDKLLAVVGPLRFLDMLCILLQPKQQPEYQHKHQVQQQQDDEGAQHHEQEHQNLMLQQLPTRLSPMSLSTLLSRLCETQGRPLFEAPKIFAACWAAENPENAENLTMTESREALCRPLKGTSISWRNFIDVAQQRQSEAFLLHVFGCIRGSALQRAAASLLEDKDPRTGVFTCLLVLHIWTSRSLPLDPWAFLMSRRLRFQSSEGSPRSESSTSRPTNQRPSSKSETTSLNIDPSAQKHDAVCIAAPGSGNGIPCLLPASAVRFIRTPQEIGEYFEALRRQQQQQTKILETDQDIKETLVRGGTPIPERPVTDSTVYSLVRHRRFSLQDLQERNRFACGPSTRARVEASLGAPPCGASPPATDTSSGSFAARNGEFWGPLKGGPHGEFLFPLEIGEPGIAGLLPLAVGLRVIGAPPHTASLMCLSVSSGTLIVDLLNRQTAYVTAVERLLQWLLTNPLLVKVVFDAKETLERLAVGPVPFQEPLGSLVHCIDLRQPRIHRRVRIMRPEADAIRRDEQFTESLTYRNERLFRDLLNNQHQSEEDLYEMETGTEVLTVGTRRTLSLLRSALLGGSMGGLSEPSSTYRSSALNRRPLDPHVLYDVADESFSLLVLERRLRQLQLYPKSILGAQKRLRHQTRGVWIENGQELN
ncbi:hypothetical protein cyc_01922 [Cyclospora cayetanensis]|uniref:3'-5' exonuclease domain-containing protein n=1 Tax=Cyclospora cayetanensis TaxID=88456 RepID=A0A1D3CSR8_9EIME|nr:hypothetical protein cyc_01922 [Cyclospora cayetanensis]